MPKKGVEGFKIYLAGRIPIGNEVGVDPLWRERYRQMLEKFIPRVVIFDPAYRNIDEEDAIAIFGHDLFLIKESDLMLVNAEIPIGLGTAQEMVIAKYFQKPVVSVSPRGSYYSPFKEKINGQKVSNWRHPFLYVFSDWILEDVKEIKYVLTEKLKNKKMQKWKTFMSRPIQYYLRKCFSEDIKTKEMLGMEILKHAKRETC